MGICDLYRLRSTGALVLAQKQCFSMVHSPAGTCQILDQGSVEPFAGCLPGGRSLRISGDAIAPTGVV